MTSTNNNSSDRVDVRQERLWQLTKINQSIHRHFINNIMRRRRRRIVGRHDENVNFFNSIGLAAIKS